MYTHPILLEVPLQVAALTQFQNCRKCAHINLQCTQQEGSTQQQQNRAAFAALIIKPNAVQYHISTKSCEEDLCSASSSPLPLQSNTNCIVESSRCNNSTTDDLCAASLLHSPLSPLTSKMSVSETMFACLRRLCIWYSLTECFT